MRDKAPTPFDQGLFLVHLNRGKEHFENRNFGEAESELEEALRLRPTDANVLSILGLTYFKQEKFRQADNVYRRLIEQNPDSHVLHFNQGLVCFKLGALDRAEAAFLRALELQPENQKINFYLGNIYEKKNQFYNAIFQYRKAGANIMVKRVQAKIQAERDGSTVTRSSPREERHRQNDMEAPGGGDVDLAEADPGHVETEATLPPPSGSRAESGGDAPSPPLKVTVDHLDRERFLTALRGARARMSPGARPRATPEPPQRPEDIFSLAAEAWSHQPPPAPEPEPELADQKPRTDDSTAELPALGRTVVRLTDPIVADQTLSELSRGKALASAGNQLFTSSTPPGGRVLSPERGDDTVRIASVRPSEPARPETVSFGRRVSFREDEEDEQDRTSPVYSRLRRRDDIFRYLEDDLMEVNFSGKVFIKQGTIYSYSGNLTFWVKPQREEGGSPPLVIVSGTGKLLLSDRQREITVMQVDGEEIFIEPSHLLACQETLTPRYAVIEREGLDKPRLNVLSIEGSGMIALSVATNPLLMTVRPGYPVNVSSADIICWSGKLKPQIVEDEALAELMLPHAQHSLNLRLEGAGKVMMERSQR